MSGHHDASYEHPWQFNTEPAAEEARAYWRAELRQAAKKAARAEGDEGIGDHLSRAQYCLGKIYDCENALFEIRNRCPECRQPKGA